MVGGALAGLGKRVLLLELNSGLRDIDLISGTDGQTVYDIQDVLSGRCGPGKAVVPSAAYPGLSIMAAPYSGGTLATQALPILCRKMSNYFDIIMIDTAAGLGYLTDAAAEVAKTVVLVLTPDPLALRDGRVVADHMIDKVGKTRLVLNRVNRKAVSNSETIYDLDEAIDIVGAQLLGVVPESEAIANAAAVGAPPPNGSTEAEIFAAIAQRLLGEDVPLIFR
jgi:septum site-determining protein MinD